MAFDKNYDHLLKVLLTGDSSVGKTSLICQFVDNEARKTHIATIGKCSATLLRTGRTISHDLHGSVTIERSHLYSIYTSASGDMIGKSYTSVCF